MNAFDSRYSKYRMYMYMDMAFRTIYGRKRCCGVHSLFPPLRHFDLTSSINFGLLSKIFGSRQFQRNIFTSRLLREQCFSFGYLPHVGFEIF